MGSPVTPLRSGAFTLSSAADRRRLYSQIPADTDILITDRPPYGILDVPPGSGLHTGCGELFDAVIRVRPSCTFSAMYMQHMEHFRPTTRHS
jgi:hypothetical protein